MFLMNPSPLVALPRKWEPFSHPRGCRYPVCFSGSEDNLPRTTVNAEVQMIINNLQSEEASPGSGSSSHGSEGRGHKPRGGLRRLQGHMADSNGTEAEECSEYVPLLSNSDSDDSVDREIEEAIQEYMKNKGQDGQPVASSGTKREAGEKLVQDECPAHDPTCSGFHAGVETAGMQWQRATEDSESDGAQWPPSPSVSSDDSFEQSIQAEIEQFLSEKKQQQARRRRMVAGRNKQSDGKEARDKPALRSQKEETYQGNQRGEDQALFLRRNPELQGARGSKCLKSESSRELADFGTTSWAQFGTSLAGPSLEQSQGGEKRQAPWIARVGNKNPSDSSSDDGIEEAIQLYQQEKIRQATVTEREHLSGQNEERQAGRAEVISVSPAVPLVKSALPAIWKKPRSRKRRTALLMPTELNQRAGRCQELQKNRSCTPPENSTVTFQACSQADTAAELMCAEAILDISKAILPPPTGSDNRPFGTDPAFGPQASQQERDAYAVDSDDSIEQEIRAFLAVKAQTERSAVEPREASCSARDPPSSSQLHKQARSPRRMSPKPLKLPLSRKRRRKRESRLSTPGPDGQPIQAETDWSCVGEARSETSASQPGNESTAPGTSWCPEDPGATVSSVDVANPFSWGQLGARNHAKKTTRNPQKYGLGDESSSLDSDEDLDTAIKDLLRSKQKQKKKTQDQRIERKKQLLFGATETMPVLEDKGKACRSKAPPLLKSCLVGSRIDLNVGNATKQPQSTAERKLKDARAVQVAYEFGDQAKPFSLPETWDFSQYPQSPWAARSLPNGSSSDDSDDSIEQEIRRFLAKKAKDSTSSTESETREADKLWTSQLKSKCQVLKGQDRAPSQQRGSMEKRDQPITGSRGSPRSETKTREKASPGGNHTVTVAEEMWSHAMAPLQRHQGLLLAPDVGVPAPRTAAESRGLCPGKLVQRDLPGEGTAEHPTAQSRFPPLCPLRRKPVCEFDISSQFIPGLKSTQPKKTAVFWGKRRGVESALLKSQGGVAASDMRWERRGALVEEAEFSPGFGAEGLPACILEESVKRKVATPLCHERVNLAKGWPWAVEGAGNQVNSSLGCPSEEPPADVGGVGIYTGLVNLGVPSREEKGKVQECGVSGREGKVTHTPRDLPLREKPRFDQGRAAEHQAPKALAGASAEFTDRLMEENAHRSVESKASNL